MRRPGRPRKYESVEELEAIIDEYFDYCFEVNENTKHINELPTVTGLCLALGLTREGLLTYQGRPEFADTIKRAKLVVENALEHRLLSGQNATGAIFNLKNNFGWKDQTQVEQNVSGSLKVTRIELVPLSDDSPN